MIWITIALFIVALGIVVFLVMKIAGSVNQQLNSVTQQLNQRLQETSTAVQDAHRTVGERLDSATRVFGDVQKSLGRLEETHKQIYEISKDIASLQDLLRAPKFRGEIGETLLARLLEDILPKEHIRVQHRFKSGDIVDAAVVVGQHLIPIDSKFPLENFKKHLEASADEEKKTHYRVFVRDVKKRIDEVSSKYILPDEGTFDFALMYIPAEGVYYQISRDEELGTYAKMKKVIFVSPNTFYAYLQAVLYGLRGVNIQRNIQKIFSELAGVQIDFKKFQDDFEVMGNHLNNATTKYNDARSKLAKINERLTNTTQNPQLESHE
ncbi:MAG: DNA recombination protein RmuC [Candidatus Omnitrophica bacterium]|nr:DNA recombination protein RmuC [Candidatus Omnitrophota bacterium]